MTFPKPTPIKTSAEATLLMSVPRAKQLITHHLLSVSSNVTRHERKG